MRHIFMYESTFRILFRCYCSQTQLSPVRVVSLNKEDTVKLALKPFRDFIRPKNESVNTLLSLIQRQAAHQKRKEEIKREIIQKYCNPDPVVVQTVEEDEDVCLIGNDKLIDGTTLNIDAWPQASILKIGDIAYEVQYNIPRVLNLTLPDYIVIGCILHPYIILECAALDDCILTWYRSKNSDCTNDWKKVGEGFPYLTSPDDSGYYLKVVCSPRRHEKIGPDFETISKNTVECGPKLFPFIERQAYTKPVSSSNRFRCVSYNTLANMYLKKRRYCYASNKARDVQYRKQLLLTEILGYNGDILCLQEVEERMFDYDFAPVFKTAGLHGLYTRKAGHTFEGLATFYRTSKFRLIFNESIILKEIVMDKDIFGDLLAKVSGNDKGMNKLLAVDTALQVVFLEAIENPAKRVLIANTHLFANKDFPEVKLIQTALCVYYLEYLVKSKFIDSTGILFCGDFNSTPNTDAYNFVTSGNFQCCPSWKNKNLNSNSDEDTTLQHNLYLESACGIPEYTNYTDEFQGCLDYIFYNKNSLDVTDIVPMPCHESVTAQAGLPSELFPSDHIPLICTLKWKSTDL